MLKHPTDTSARPTDDLTPAPIFAIEGNTSRGTDPRGRDAARRRPTRSIHDELMLDGNARLNLATFVTTWMEPQAQR